MISEKVKSLYRFSSLSIDDIFASMNILRRIGNINKFQLWLKEYHDVNEFSVFFEGFKIFIQTLLLNILDNIMYSDFPNLQEDVNFRRIKDYLDDPFYPFPEPTKLADIPNSCNKIIFLKNILHLINAISKSKDIISFENAYEKINTFLRLIYFIYRNFTKTNFDIQKDVMIKIKSSQFLNTLFDQMHNSRGFPVDWQYYTYPYAFDLAKYFELENLTDHYRGIIFKGYLYTLQYSWFKLIGKEKFSRTKINNLTQIVDNELNEILSKKDFASKKIIDYWNKIDYMFYSTNYAQIIRPLLNKHPIIDNYKSRFVIEIDEEVDEKLKKRFKIFLNCEKAGNPNYLSRSDNESIIKQLDFEFSWLPIEIVGFSGESSFYGAKSFITFLKGIATNFQNYGENSESIRVKIIKNPVKGAMNKVIGYQYSFAFLPLYDRNYYRSGWILFHICFGDVFDDGKEYVDDFFEEIKNLEFNKLIYTEELQVDYTAFMNYITNRNLSFFRFREYKDLLPRKPIVDDLKKANEKIMTIIKAHQSRIFEDMVRKWLRENEKQEISDTGYYITRKDEKNEFEIDIIVKNDESNISLYECKLNIKQSDIDDNIVSKIIEKAELLTSNDKKYKNKNYSNYIVVWYEVESIKRRNLFESRNIQIIDNFKEIIKKLPNFKTEKRSIVNFFKVKE